MLASNVYRLGSQLEPNSGHPPRSAIYAGAEKTGSKGKHMKAFSKLLARTSLLIETGRTKQPNLLLATKIRNFRYRGQISEGLDQ